MENKLCRSCHQFYFGTESCPTCGNFKCWDCGKIFHINLSRIKPDRQYNTCPDCRKSNKKYTLKCEKHGFYYSNSPIRNCKLCKEENKSQFPQFRICNCGEVYIQQTIKPPFLCNKCKIKNLGKWGNKEQYDEEVFNLRRENGSKIMTKLHENDGLKFCPICKHETYHILAVGCLKCHNNSDIMRKATSNRNYQNWKNDPDYRKRISQNLGKYLYEGKSSIYTREESRITHVSGKLLKDFFGFEPTGFYKNETKKCVTSNDQVACRWKNNGDNIFPINEFEYNNSKFIYTYENGRVTYVSGVSLSDFFGFEPTGFYKNETKKCVTSNDQVACRWKNNGDNIFPIDEFEYNNSKFIYTREEGRITHVSGVPLSDFFGFKPTGFYKNETKKCVTSNDQVACRWKNNGDNVIPISESKYIYDSTNSIYTREEGRITHVSGKLLKDFFGFEPTGFYKNETRKCITSNDQVACRWKNNGDDIFPIDEFEYNNSKFIYTRENGRVTHVAGVSLSDFFEFRPTGFYKNETKKCVTSNDQVACRWKNNGDNVIPISESKYIYDSTNSIYTREEGRITHINEIPIESCYKILPDKDIISIDFPNGFFIKTGLSQGQVGRFIGKEALDQRLCDLGVGYFVYIKYYIKNDISLPLQVCKSTTSLVSLSPPDFSFDYTKGGPARQFLLDHNFQWDQEKVFIIPISKEDYGFQGCPSQTEKYIHDEIKLFY